MVMDISGALLRATGITAGVPPELIGKWLHSAAKGHIFVDNIRTSVGRPVPLKQFMPYHYLIGVILTFLFFIIVSIFRISHLPWWLPILYGLATSLIPLFLMFPGMGFGPLGLKGPDEYLLLRTALLNHLFFGLGLALTFKWLLKY
jgi:hypothetical protein